MICVVIIYSLLSRFILRKFRNELAITKSHIPIFEGKVPHTDVLVLIRTISNQMLKPTIKATLVITGTVVIIAAFPRVVPLVVPVGTLSTIIIIYVGRRLPHMLCERSLNGHFDMFTDFFLMCLKFVMNLGNFQR